MSEIERKARAFDWLAEIAKYILHSPELGYRVLDYGFSWKATALEAVEEAAAMQAEEPKP